MKTKQPVNIYAILSFIIAYYKKKQAHAEKTTQKIHTPSSKTHYGT